MTDRLVAEHWLRRVFHAFVEHILISMPVAWRPSHENDRLRDSNLPVQRCRLIAGISPSGFIVSLEHGFANDRSTYSKQQQKQN